MKKISALILSTILGMSVLGGCAKQQAKEESKETPKETKEVRVYSPDGLPSIALAKLIKEKPEVAENYNVNYNIAATADELSTIIMKGEADIAVVPSNMASIAYNKNKETNTCDYKIAGTVGYGSLYLVSNQEITSYEDLKGKTILNIGKGLTPDIVTQVCLKNNGIDVEKDVTLDYVDSATELVPAIVAGKVDIAVVPEPALSGLLTKKPDMKIVYKINDEYKKIAKTEKGFPQSTIIVRSDIAKDHPEFLSAFLAKVDESIKWATENKTDLGTYSKEVGIKTEPAIIEKSIERANLGYTPIKDNSKDYMTYYKYLNEFNPKTLGGSIPDEEVFIK
ncbi:MAG: PhnD/SsuA/transferrin family substrate-binding protein [Clostridioides sp.]|jgi:NitT/TauT family transport system substrate-binding protein|nr:PhnD/SsuA/transferrin family substrate-binding protein [Clostridioides sp.]